ncbi:MAG: cysteine sulfinate desulfinase [Cycloclasticus sp. symbiont of Bathymodiolus heckerae]|nr:MAG: cysteine sulfinate desulfinase [Cycloclasticus sp. symbiont of Bathymodiolus heckerae]
MAITEAVNFMDTYDVEAIRKDFPVLDQKIRGKQLVYLDNAATSQKPKAVIDSIVQYYENDNANIHRGVHTLSERATLSYETARKTVQKFLNAETEKEIIFTRGATEAINLVANAFAEKLSAGDEVLITAMEHHSNIVPWQMLCEKTGAELKVAPINDKGELIFEEFEALVSKKTKFAAISHMSNALGTINPIKQMIDLLHQHNVPVLVDGAQAIPHIAVDVQALDCEFYVFSGHKLYAPTGIGALYGKMEQLEQMAPYQGGGDMISVVTFESTVYNKIPYKFEAGTPNIAGTIGLGAAIEYINNIGIDAIAAHENSLLEYAIEQSKKIDKLRIIGTAENKGAIMSFVLDGIHPHDIGTMMDHQGIAVRAGHHCAMPVMDFFGVPATARASFAMYNTHQEVDALMAGIENLIEMFG